MSNEQQWVRVQEQVFTSWLNSVIAETGLKVNSIQTDLTPEVLKALAESLTMKKMKTKMMESKSRIHMLNNYTEVLAFLKENNIDTAGCSPENLLDAGSGYKFILGMMFSVYRKFFVEKSLLPADNQAGQQTAENTKMESMIIQWVNTVTHPYGVQLENISSGLSDGRVLLALVDAYTHNNCFQTLEQATSEERVRTATGIAESDLKVQQVFSVEEIVNGKTDERAMALYLSLFLQAFRAKEMLASQTNQITEREKESQLQIEQQKKEIEERESMLQQQQMQMEQQKNQMNEEMMKMKQQQEQLLKEQEMARQQEAERANKERENLRQQQQQLEVEKQRMIQQQEQQRQQMQQEMDLQRQQMQQEIDMQKQQQLEFEKQRMMQQQEQQRQQQQQLEVEKQRMMQQQEQQRQQMQQEMDLQKQQMQQEIAQQQVSNTQQIAQQPMQQPVQPQLVTPQFPVQQPVQLQQPINQPIPQQPTQPMNQPIPQPSGIGYSSFGMAPQQGVGYVQYGAPVQPGVGYVQFGAPVVTGGQPSLQFEPSPVYYPPP